MPSRAFRDYFMPERKSVYERDLSSPNRTGNNDPRYGHFEDDPYERCDFDEEED